MSGSLEERLDLALRLHHQHRPGHEADHPDAGEVTDTRFLEHVHRAERFASSVRRAMQDAVAHANSHFAKSGTNWELCDVSGYYTGPLCPCGSGCNPIAYELRVDGCAVGETLIIALTLDGMVEAFLAPWRPPFREADTGRIGLGWSDVALDAFDPAATSDIVVRFVSHVCDHCDLHWAPGPAASERAARS